MLRLLVLMTTHNNEKQCLESISHLSAACDKAGVVATVYLANSGAVVPSVPQRFRQITIREFPTSNDTFWAKGMRQAWEFALRESDLHDLVLWLNDDTLLDRDALEKLVEVLDSEDGKSVAVGPCRSADGKLTYGGLKRAGFFKPLHLLKMEEKDAVAEADTFNGNVVLSNFKTHKAIGGFPEGFTHLRADLDFGFTCSSHGIRNIVLAGTVAVCEENNMYKNYRSLIGLPLPVRLKEIDSPKFGPLKEHIRFSLRHGGLFGIFYALAPIVRAVVGR